MRIRGPHIVATVLVLIAGFIVFAVLQGGQAATRDGGSTVTPRPKLSMATEFIDMGTIVNTGPSDVETSITNKGNAPLRIISVSGSCPCIWATMETNLLQPGETVPLTITMDPFLIYGFHADKTLSVRTNDPSLPIGIIKVVCDIEPEFQLEPESLDFGTVQAGTEAEMHQILRQVREEPVELLDLDTGRGLRDGIELTHELLPASEWRESGKAEYRITARLTPDLPAGRHVQYYEVLTNVERLERGLRSALTANVVAFYELEPARVVQLSRLKPGETRLEAVTVTSEQPVHVEDLALNDERLVASAHPAEDGTAVRIAIQAGEGVEAGRVNAELSFTVRGEDETARATLRVFGLIDTGAAG